MSEDILKYIKLGTDYKEYFNYDGSPLPIRPLSTYELDEATQEALKGITPLVFESVVKVKLGVLEDDEDIDLEPYLYLDYLKYYNELDYWIVYFGMKDFQEKLFSVPDYDGTYKKDFLDWDESKPKGYYIVRKMKYVHRLSQDILTMTDTPTIKLVEFLYNNDSKVLASMVHAFHIPLTSEAWKLTPLQTKFIVYTRPGAPEILESIEDLPGIKGGTLEEISKQLGSMGFDVG